MVSTEEKNLKKIREDFTVAIKLLQNNKFPEATKAFSKIIAGNKDSSYTSITQVQMRSNVYKDYIDFKLSTVNNKPKNEEDLLNAGLLMLNRGKLEKAESHFNSLIDKKFSSPYFYYLLAILNIKKEETDEALNYLKKSFEGDETFKINAFNESDFEDLKENEDFQSIITIDC